MIADDHRLAGFVRPGDSSHDVACAIVRAYAAYYPQANHRPLGINERKYLEDIIALGITKYAEMNTNSQKQIPIDKTSL